MSVFPVRGLGAQLRFAEDVYRTQFLKILPFYLLLSLPYFGLVEYGPVLEGTRSTSLVIGPVTSWNVLAGIAGTLPRAYALAYAAAAVGKLRVKPQIRFKRRLALILRWGLFSTGLWLPSFLLIEQGSLYLLLAGVTAVGQLLFSLALPILVIEQTDLVEAGRANVTLVSKHSGRTGGYLLTAMFTAGLLLAVANGLISWVTFQTWSQELRTSFSVWAVTLRFIPRVLESLAMLYVAIFTAIFYLSLRAEANERLDRQS